MELKTEDGEIPNAVVLKEIAGLRIKSVSTVTQTDLNFQRFDEILKRKVNNCCLIFFRKMWLNLSLLNLTESVKENLCYRHKKTQMPS